MDCSDYWGDSETSDVRPYLNQADAITVEGFFAKYHCDSDLVSAKSPLTKQELIQNMSALSAAIRENIVEKMFF